MKKHIAAVCYDQTPTTYAADDAGLAWTRNRDGSHKFSTQVEAGRIAREHATGSKGTGFTIIIEVRKKRRAKS